MALHRDIHWIGRQWAVTGYGMQLIDQRHGGQFDIEIARLWDDRVMDAVSTQKWFNPADFAKGLTIARERHVRTPPDKVDPLLSSALPVAEKVEPATSAAVEAPRPKTPGFHVRAAGSAKFVRPWRVRLKR